MSFPPSCQFCVERGIVYQRGDKKLCIAHNRACWVVFLCALNKLVIILYIICTKFIAYIQALKRYLLECLNYSYYGSGVKNLIICCIVYSLPQKNFINVFRCTKQVVGYSTFYFINFLFPSPLKNTWIICKIISDPY